jgi:hypothetical protein
MKQLKLYPVITVCTAFLFLNACVDLNLNPLSEASNGNWNSTEEEVNMSVNNFYSDAFWGHPKDDLTDDLTYRDQLRATTAGDITSEWDQSGDLWRNSYKGISRANMLLSTIDRAKGVIDEIRLDRYKAETRFFRAYLYSRLIFHFGDVVYFDEPVELSDAAKARTSKSEILKKIYEDFDYAVNILPANYGNGQRRATKGAAYALKARVALHCGDWTTARDAALACMNLNEYELSPSFPDLFRVSTKALPATLKENIWTVPFSVQYNHEYTGFDPRNLMTRNAGGFAAEEPTWTLFCSFLCTDGKPIDESPLFDPHNPFQNRDPRCAATIVEFGTSHLGFIYDPHPDAEEIRNDAGRWIMNNDCRFVNTNASWLGLVYKKGIDNSWKENGMKIDPDLIIVRYADVLLMYAEAKIELNEIDQNLRDAMNDVRARAYGVKKEDTAAYPVITNTNQSELRKILRIERRMEFAHEGLRYYDLIRWKLAEKALTKPLYGLIDYYNKPEVVNFIRPHWFFAEVPPIDEDGIADFSGMAEKGFVRQLVLRVFPQRQYLWPIPKTDVLVYGLEQNAEY